MASRLKAKITNLPTDGHYFIRSKHNNLVLDAKGEGKTPGTKVQFLISNYFPGYCLAIKTQK